MMKWAGKLSGAVVKTVKTAPSKTTGTIVKVKDDFITGYRETAGEKKIDSTAGAE